MSDTIESTVQLSTMVNLPSDLWAIILTYTNDITSCNTLYTSLPDYVQTAIAKIYHIHLLSLSINIVFANVTTVSIYTKNTLYIIYAICQPPAPRVHILLMIPLIFINQIEPFVIFNLSEQV